MSLRPLTTPWFHGPAGHEKIWLGCAILWCFVMSLMMPYWHFRGKQNSTGEAYTVKPADFFARTEKFVAASGRGTLCSARMMGSGKFQILANAPETSP